MSPGVLAQGCRSSRRARPEDAVVGQVVGLTENGNTRPRSRRRVDSRAPPTPICGVLYLHPSFHYRLAERRWPMSNVTQILSAIEHGNADAARQLLPLVYDELRKLAAARLAQENPGQTLQPTALVHEAYVRLVDVD